ncbi:hypothetical protein CNY89_29100, partial [Amaricoccus sp. HAR-UPW-R2A-40]
MRRIGMSDLGEALRLGWEDFKACRSDVTFLVVLYPVIGLALPHAGPAPGAAHRDERPGRGAASRLGGLQG